MGMCAPKAKFQVSRMTIASAAKIKKTANVPKLGEAKNK